MSGPESVFVRVNVADGIPTGVHQDRSYFDRPGLVIRGEEVAEYVRAPTPGEHLSNQRDRIRALPADQRSALANRVPTSRADDRG